MGYIYYIAMKKNNKIDTMEQFLLSQPRNITVAKHKLGIHQLRILARAIEQLQDKMSFEVDHTQNVESEKVKIKVGDIIVQNNVKPLREALNGMMKKIVKIMHYIPEKATYLEIGTTLIQSYKYEHGSSDIEIQISGHLLPQLIDLSRGFTKYSLDVAFSTSSVNTFKLYQYVASFRDKKQIRLNVSTLREWLQLEDKYKMPARIKERILEPAMKELKEIADVWFTIAERVMDGRKMKGWKFNIHTKKEPKKNKTALLEQKPKESLREQKGAEISQEVDTNGSKKKAMTSWDICLDVLSDHLSEEDFNTWFKPIKPQRYENNTLYILAPSDFLADWIKKNYAKLIEQTATYLGDGQKIKIVVEDLHNQKQKQTPKKRSADTIISVLKSDFLLRKEAIKTVVTYIENPKTSDDDAEICKKTILKMASWVKNNDKIGAPDKLIIKRLSEKFGIKF